MPPGTSVSSQQRLHPNPPVVSAYVRQFAGVRLEGRPAIGVVSTGLLYKAPGDAANLISRLSLATSSSALRKLATKQIADQFAASSHLAVSKVALVRIGGLRLGDESIDLVFAVKTNQGTFDVGEAWVRLDRGVTALYYGSVARPIARPVIRSLLQNAVTRMEGQLLSVPVNDKAPTIVGSAVSGQRLIGTGGAWSGDIATFSYEWRRCGATGGDCTPIPQASQLIYVVSPTDVGAQLVFAVTATNAAGKTTAVSAPTALVPR
jgi:hypothetical protein